MTTTQSSIISHKVQSTASSRKTAQKLERKLTVLNKSYHCTESRTEILFPWEANFRFEEPKSGITKSKFSEESIIHNSDYSLVGLLCTRFRRNTPMYTMSSWTPHRWQRPSVFNLKKVLLLDHRSVHKEGGRNYIFALSPIISCTTSTNFTCMYALETR